MKDSAYIYLIKNPSGSVYVGKTINLKKRIERYRVGLCESQVKIYRSIMKYGWDSHEIKILHKLPGDCTNDTINQYEIFYISRFKECGFKMMNLTEGGDGILGKKHTEETKSKISQKAKERGMHENTRKAVIAFHTGRIMPLEQREKISMSNKGKVVPPEVIAKMSESKKGKVFTEEHKRRLSESHIGKSPWNKGLTGYKRK